jgi:PhnB protein
LVVRDAAAAIDFYRVAFAAEEIGELFAGPSGEVIHAEVRIGDSVVMITEESGDSEAPPSPPSPQCIMATYWEDVDVAWERAVAAGAEVIYPLANHFYGERGGRLRDPVGQQWTLSQRTEQLSREEMNRRAAGFFGSS